MWKSRGNVVNPDDIVREYGADALRLYEIFMGPLEAVKPWQTSQVQGVVRFRDRLHAVRRQPLVDAMDDATRRLLHKTIKRSPRTSTRWQSTRPSRLCLPLIHLVGSRRPPQVFVMESTDAWYLNHPALTLRLRTPWLGRVLASDKCVRVPL